MDGTKAYRYSIRDGKFTVQEGIVNVSHKTRYKTLSFYTEKVRYIVASKPGVVLNSCVWLYEQNDEEARSLLEDHEIRAIVKMDLQIRKCKDKCIALRNAPIRKDG